MKTFRIITSLALAGTAATSLFAAKETRPNVAIPAAYRDADLGRWKVAGEAPATSEGWWKLYDDPALTALIERALAQNQDLVAAAARVDQARAAAGLARSAFFPSVQVDAAASRGRSLDTLYQTTNYINVPLTASYELDLWGRVRNSNKAARRELSAQSELFAAARLALTAEVAETFISLRATSRELEIVRDTVATRREARDVIAARLHSGTATDLDLARAETEFATVEAEASGIEQRYAQLETALAVLVGQPAPSFRAAIEKKIDFAVHRPPAIPIGLPGSLLERRPDIAAAQDSFLAANARIKVAKAAFFPDISITGAAGYESADFDNVFRWDQRVWSFGPRLYLPIFQGGRNRANLGRAEAAFDEAVAQYRQSVLIAFREVQDALTASRLLDEQVAAQERAAANARKAAGLSRTRYDAGYVGYLEVVDSERSALGAERALVQLRAQRLVTSVALIKALGGGWAETVPGRS
ncbi:MAG TPA: efflux transporter outer membrane subunit [Opitutaceae bacterium]|nr:efflux transporter outer membrane subunit [Opitutaceae bacterium]